MNKQDFFDFDDGTPVEEFLEEVKVREYPDLNEEQEAALIEFRDGWKNSKMDWREGLADAWRTGWDVESIRDGHLLRQIRNQFGPSWLFKQ